MTNKCLHNRELTKKGCIRRNIKALTNGIITTTTLLSARIPNKDTLYRAKDKLIMTGIKGMNKAKEPKHQKCVEKRKKRLGL